MVRHSFFIVHRSSFYSSFIAYGSSFIVSLRFNEGALQIVDAPQSIPDQIVFDPFEDPVHASRVHKVVDSDLNSRCAGDEEFDRVFSARNPSPADDRNL